MSINRTLVLVVGLLISVGTALLPSTASAVETRGLEVRVPSDRADGNDRRDPCCPGSSNRLNMWEDDAYEGQYEGRESFDTDFGNDGFSDDLSSFTNKTGDFWVAWEDDNYAGDNFCVRPRSYEPNIGNDTSLEDDITSVRRKQDGTRPSVCGAVVGRPLP